MTDGVFLIVVLASCCLEICIVWSSNVKVRLEINYVSQTH